MLYLHVHGDDAAIARALQVAEGYGPYWGESRFVLHSPKKKGRENPPLMKF